MAKKPSSKKEKSVMICPKCKSQDVSIDNSNSLQSVMGLPTMYICNKCKYSGYAFPEVKLSELSKFKEEKVNKKPISKTKKDDSSPIDTSYGNFEVRAFWKISAPITLLFGIYLLFKEPLSGTIITLIGLFMFYITYFKKRKLKD
jgi:hypothetical protein